MSKTEINDLPVPEKELTEDEARKIQGGLFRPVAGGTATAPADDITGTGPNDRDLVPD